MFLPHLPIADRRMAQPVSLLQEELHLIVINGLLQEATLLPLQISEQEPIRLPLLTRTIVLQQQRFPFRILPD